MMVPVLALGSENSVSLDVVIMSRKIYRHASEVQETPIRSTFKASLLFFPPPRWVLLNYLISIYTSPHANNDIIISSDRLLMHTLCIVLRYTLWVITAHLFFFSIIDNRNQELVSLVNCMVKSCSRKSLSSVNNHNKGYQSLSKIVPILNTLWLFNHKVWLTQSYKWDCKVFFSFMSLSRAFL